MMQYSLENRENALKHLQEAGDFLDRIKTKKAAEVEKWKQRLKSIEAREQLLIYYRHKRKYDQKKGKYRRRNNNSRFSVWDIDKVLLTQLLDDFTDEERKELSEYCKQVRTLFLSFYYQSYEENVMF